MISMTNPPLRRAALALARCSAARSSSSALNSTSLAQSLSNSLAQTLPARLPQDILKIASVSTPPRRRDVPSPVVEIDDFLFGVGARRPAARPATRGNAGASRHEDELGSLLLPSNACF